MGKEQKQWGVKEAMSNVDFICSWKWTGYTVHAGFSLLPGLLYSMELHLIYTRSSGTGSLPFSSAKQTFVTWKEKHRILKI